LDTEKKPIFPGAYGLKPWVRQLIRNPLVCLRR
jgi:hypothetical protein